MEGVTVPRLMTAAVDFGREIEALKTPREIIQHLHERIAREVKVNVLNAWRIPRVPGDWTSLSLGKDIFPHSSVSKQYWSEFFEGLKRYGYTDIEQYVLRKRMPFTWTESKRENQPVGSARWTYDVKQKYGMRDGFVVPVANWRISFWSPHVLRLTPHERNLLICAAGAALARLEAITSSDGRKRGSLWPLSPKEKSTLLLTGPLGKSIEEAAEDMGVKATTFKTYRRRAQNKLGATSPEHAIALAMRRGLIS